MQTKARSSSGTGQFTHYWIFIGIASFFLLALSTSHHDAVLIKAHPNASSDPAFTSAVKKMFEATNQAHRHDIARALNEPVDTNQLKKSDWFSTVKKDIEKRMYYMIGEKDPKTFSSINNAQSLKATYSAGQLSLQPILISEKKPHAKNDWQLNIIVAGIYEDGRLLQQPACENAVASNNDNNVEYNFGDIYSIQYQNDSKGIRQNFIVKEKPATDVRELKVGLKTEGDWVVNKVHDRELHFAKKKSHGELENKITYNDLKAWDANGKALAARMEVEENNNFEIITEVAGAAYPVTIDPLSTSPSTTLAGTGTFGNSVASAGDVNGDGYSDVIVGSASTGAAYIFLGSASGLSSSPATTLTGLGSFGLSVASAGDVNGDGISDVIIGDGIGDAFLFNGVLTTGIASGTYLSANTTLTNASTNFGFSVATAGDVNGDGISDVIIGDAGGHAYIFDGALTTGIASGNISTATATLTGLATFGLSVASAGDVNGDGVSDVIIGDAIGDAFIFNGVLTTGITNASYLTASTTLTGSGRFGISVASAGDVNGDGYSDVIVGAPAILATGGSAYIYLGSSSGLSAVVSTTLTGGVSFGFSVSGAGDVNGDAYADVIVGDTLGTAFVYNGTKTGIASGNTSTASTTLSGSADYGLSVSSAGDVNGDGYSDVAVGEPGGSGAFTYHGSPTGSINTSTISILGTSDGGSNEDRLGFSVSSAGDINGDGYSDVVIGVIGYNALTGAAYIYYGSSTGLSKSSPAPAILSVGGSATVGWSVAGAGDINGDGYDDVIVATPQANGDQGAVYIYLGSPSGIANGASPTATLTGVNPNDNFGTSVASAGDVNGDGYYDIIVGAPNAGVNSQGVAYLYMGSSTGILSSASADTLYGVADFVGLGISVASAGDVNGDGYSDIIIGAYGNNTAYVFKGSKTGIANNATADYVLTGSGTFGISVSSAGDVNGDGFSDVIVGAYTDAGGSGTASVFLGSSGGLSNVPATVLTGLTSVDQFGTSVSSAGDVNGDGYSDVIIRATLATSNAGAQTGAAYIFLGGSAGLSSTIATSFLDEGSTDAKLEGFNFRRSVASAGDVNGDGYSDVLAGVYVDNTLNTKNGALHVYYGNNDVGHNASNVLRLYETDLTNPIRADNLTQHDFGLGLFVQSPFGTVKGRLVWETESNGTPFQGYPTSITNNVVITGRQASYSTIAAGGTEFKNLIPKSPAKATKVRVRIQYAPAAVTFGQSYSPWIYSQVYLQGGNLGVLPLDLLSFTANTSGQNILLNWKTSGEDDLQTYVVMHSLNASAFDSIGSVVAKGNTVSTSSYDFTHYNPGAGVHYYRLKEVDVNGHFTYSPIVSAKISGSGPEINIYPNPASDHIVISYQGITGNYVRIMNAAGSVVGQYSLNPNSGQTTISLNGFAKGNYFVEIVNSGFVPKQITVQ